MRSLKRSAAWWPSSQRWGRTIIAALVVAALVLAGAGRNTSNASGTPRTARAAGGALTVWVDSVRLPAGEYVIGYEHGDNGLLVHFYEASTGKPVGSVLAKQIPGTTRVEAFRIWPPEASHAGGSAEHSMIQIGRFGFSYQIGG